MPIYKVGGTVVQTEDEIAAANMAIGSNYAECVHLQQVPDRDVIDDGSYGLSGMTETPFVVINTQRGGPSTGLPTKNNQT